MSEEDIIEKTNNLMDRFYRETGIWPIGRSMPAAMCGGESKEMIQARAYESWIKQDQRIAELEQQIDGCNTAMTGYDRIITELRNKNEKFLQANETLASNNNILKLGFDEVKADNKRLKERIDEVERSRDNYYFANERLKELADGAKVQVELFNPEGTAQKQWKKYWLGTCRELLESEEK